MDNKIRMGLIATYPKMAEIFMQLIKDRDDVEGENVYASFERAVEIAKKMEARGEVDVILSRGGTAAQIRDAVDCPVVFIPITPFDVIKIIHEIKKDHKKVAFIHYMKNVYGIQDIAKMYNITIEEYAFVNYFDIEDAVKDAKEKGIHAIIGGEVAVRIADNYGLQGFQVSAGKEAVERAVTQAISLYRERMKEKERTIQSKTAYDSLKEGIVVTDENKMVVVMNPIARKIFENKYRVGYVAGPTLINDQCKEVYRTQKEVPVYLKKFKKQTYAVAHFPVMREGKFIGVVSRYEDVTKTQELEQKIRKELHQKGFRARYHFEDIITENEAMLKLIKRAEAYAKADSAVLIEGESGTGKELLAQSVHNGSERREGPFVAVNCAAIPENLLESELFGYEPGAFTGAKKEGKAGLFELAHRGTLFLDEIGEISKSVQTRLLRVLQEKEIMRVGGNKIIPIDVRIISATNQNLGERSVDGSFRGDLYYRLNVLKLHLPALRERGNDIAVLAEKLLQNSYEDTSKLDYILPALMSYQWPGNIRELQNTMERYGVLLNVLGEKIMQEEGFEQILGLNPAKEVGASMKIDLELEGTLNDMIDQVEYQITNYYLEKYNNNQDLAAKALGIGRTTFWRKCKRKLEE